MTLSDFERTVLLFANHTPTMYWMHWNYPCQEPWVMALKVYRTTGFNPPDEALADQLRQRGLEWDEVNRVYVCRRTNEDGTGFTSPL